MEVRAHQETELRPDWSGYVMLSLVTMPMFVMGVYVLAQGRGDLKFQLETVGMGLLWPGLMLWVWGHRLVLRDSTVIYKRLLLPDLVIHTHEVTGIEYVMLTSFSPWPYRMLVMRGSGRTVETCLINVKLFSLADIKTLTQALNLNGLEIKKVVRRGA